MTPLTLGAVTALAQTAATSPAHLDPQVVQQVCQEWADLMSAHGTSWQRMCRNVRENRERAEDAEHQRTMLETMVERVLLILRAAPAQTLDEAVALCRVDCDDYKARAEQAESALAAARAALQAVEWTSLDPLAIETPQCPWCLSYEEEGHTTGCARQSALGVGTGEG